MRDELASIHKCATCSRGTVTKFRDGRLLTGCSVLYEAEPFEGMVESCTSYLFHYNAPPTRMEKIAWVLEVKKGRIAGFRAPQVPSVASMVTTMVHPSDYEED